MTSVVVTAEGQQGGIAWKHVTQEPGFKSWPSHFLAMWLDKLLAPLSWDCWGDGVKRWRETRRVPGIQCLIRVGCEYEVYMHIYAWYVHTHTHMHNKYTAECNESTESGKVNLSLVGLPGGSDPQAQAFRMSDRGVEKQRKAEGLAQAKSWEERTSVTAQGPAGGRGGA